MSGKNKLAVFGFPGTYPAAKALARELGVPAHQIEVHTFPDHETRVRVLERAETAVLYRPLHDPNAKIFEVIQAAAALRDMGAKTIEMVCPYLPYMRQDKVFRKGEALSQTIFGKVLAPWIDGLTAVEPHLHRTRTLDEVFEGIRAIALSGGKIMADYVRQKGFDQNALVLGPDVEAWHTARPFAEALGLEWVTAAKKRRGDRTVEVRLKDGDFKGRRVIIVDDVISTGMTVINAARAAFAKGAAGLEVYAVHALFDQKTAQDFKAAGIKTVASCDGVPHPSNKIPLAPALAKALKA